MTLNHLEILARKIQQGDEKAFEELYEQLSDKVFAFVFSFVHNRADAEDLTQDTFIKVKQNIDKFRLYSNFRAWIFEIAKNITLNFLKKNERVTLLDEEVPTNDQNEALLVYDLKTFLTEKEFQILLLHAVAGLKHKEIAKLLNMPSGTVSWVFGCAAKKKKQYLNGGSNEKL